MCGSRKYPYYPHGRSLEIPREGGEGGGDLKAKLLKEKYEANLEFPGGWGGAKWKVFHGGSIFSGTTKCVVNVGVKMTSQIWCKNWNYLKPSLH